MITGTAARVVVVDDDTVIREGMAALLPVHEVVGTYTSVEALLEDSPEADIVLLDLDLSGANQQGVIGELEAELALLGLRREDIGIPDAGARRAREPRVGVEAVTAAREAGYCVLVYTNLRNRVVLASCLAAGAAGIVHKVDSIDTVASAISDALDGQIVLTDALVGLAQIVERHGNLPQLGPRQRQVLNGRARGDTFRRIARDLGIGEKTAQEYMDEVNKKFAQSLRRYSPADLQRLLGLGPDNLAGGDL